MGEHGFRRAAAWLAAIALVVPPLPAVGCACQARGADHAAAAGGDHACCRAQPQLAKASNGCRRNEARVIDCHEDSGAAGRTANLKAHNANRKLADGQHLICTCSQPPVPQPATPAEPGTSPSDQTMQAQGLVSGPQLPAIVENGVCGVQPSDVPSPATSLQRCILLSRFVI